MAMVAGAMLRASMRAVSEDAFAAQNPWGLSTVELLPQHYAAEVLTSLSSFREAPYPCLNFAGYRIVFCATIFTNKGTAGLSRERESPQRVVWTKRWAALCVVVMRAAALGWR